MNHYRLRGLTLSASPADTHDPSSQTLPSQAQYLRPLLTTSQTRTPESFSTLPERSKFGPRPVGTLKNTLAL